MKKNKLVLPVFLAWMTVVPAKAQEILTLERTLEIAFEHSPTLVQSRISLEQQQLNLKAQQASLKSQFSLNVNPFNYSRRNMYDNFNSKWYAIENMSSSASLGIYQPIKWTDGSIGLYNDVSWQNASNRTSGGKDISYNHNLSLRIEQPLFTYNRTKMQLRELELSLENAQLHFAIQQLNIEKNVTTTFYSVYQSQKDLQIARDEVDNQRRNASIISNKAEAGLVPREELYQAEVNLAKAEASLNSRLIDLEDAKDRFKLSIGMPLDQDFVLLPNTVILPVKVNTDEAVHYGLTRRMEIRQQQITVEKDMFGLIRAKSENEFKGNVTARIGLDALGGKIRGMYDNPTDNEEIGISLTIPIFDWGAKRARVKSTQLGIEATQLNFDEEQKTIALDIRQICRRLPVLLSQVDIQKKSVENAERTYTIQSEKYRNGNLSGMELQQYQSQLTQAQQAYTNAIISYKLELLNLKIQTLWDFENNRPLPGMPGDTPGLRRGFATSAPSQ